MLFFFDIYKEFPNVRGLNDQNFPIETISIFSHYTQEKGLFVPIHDSNLDVALENGAIAALWKDGTDVPSYTPNHFPIIFVKDPLEALLQICEGYLKNIIQKECDTMTKVAFYEPRLLNTEPYTYDIAGEYTQIQLINTVKTCIESKRRG